jgi:hypothetical protein
MKRLAFLVVLAVGFVPVASAQSELGAYVDYLRLGQTNTNFAGLGGRLGLPVFPHVKLEGEISYDFNQVFTETFTSTSTITVTRSNLRLLHGLFGPKIEVGHGSFHPFLTVKGGFLNSRFDPRPATLNTFLSSVDNLRSQNVSGILYPGGGLEGHFGPLGLRLDVGDEIYFNAGTHHNLRVAFGPYIRF